jgi:hypothetical protein
MLETNQNRPSAVYGSQYINTQPNNVAYPSNIITVTESVIHPYPSVPSSSIYGEQQPPSYKNLVGFSNQKNDNDAFNI